MSDEIEEIGDPSVPTELLELHIYLEDEGMTAEEFKEVCDNAVREEK